MTHNIQIIDAQKIREDLKGTSLSLIAHELFGVDANIVEEVIQESINKEKSLTENLIEKKIMNSAQIAQCLASFLGLEYVANINVDSLNDEFLTLIPISFAKANRLLPIVQDENDNIIVICSDPLNIADYEEELKLVFGKNIKFVVTSFETILTAINSA